MTSPRWPLPVVKITSRYGYRRHPQTGRKSFHTGIDLQAPKGTKVRPVLPGHIAYKTTTPAEGNIVHVDHGNGIVSKYKHLAGPCPLSRGDEVDTDVIGRVGDTGSTARGAHLHLEVWIHGKRVDPLQLLEPAADDEPRNEE